CGGRVRRGAWRHLAAAHAVLRAFGGVVPAADRHDRRCAAGPGHRWLGAACRAARCQARRCRTPPSAGEPGPRARPRGRCAAAGTLEPGRVIVTAPPHLAGRIEYYPELPYRRAQLTQRTPMGSVIKCQVIYDEPFWRRDGLSGQATGDGTGSRVVFDNSPPDGTPGILLAFVEGDEARRLGREPATVRRQAVGASLVRYFGPRAAKPEGFLELDWQQERWSGGCYGTLFGPNVWTRYGPALREPVGLIHWAGTETSSVWTGYMDGAIRSGERAAAEVLAVL